MNNSILPQPIKLKATISSVGSRTDKSLRLTIITPPLESSEKTPFMELQQVPLFVEITPQNNIEAPPLVIDKDIETKSQSERIRNVLYVWWKQSDSDMSFDEFYRYHTEKIIDKVKEKLHE